MATYDISSIIQILFFDILKVSSSSMAEYSTPTDQLVFLFFIPHVVLFLFIYGFSAGIVGRIVSGHRGLQYLLGIAVYLYIIMTGMYGQTLLPLFQSSPLWWVHAFSTCSFICRNFAGDGEMSLYPSKKTVPSV